MDRLQWGEYDQTTQAIMAELKERFLGLEP
jgi:hypothetical protein